MMTLQRSVVSLLEAHGLKPLNSTEDLYTPHLTLARVNHISLEGFPKDLFSQDRFELVLGESDQQDQLIQVLHRF
jgi:2'-5' RNA ligase